MANRSYLYLSNNSIGQDFFDVIPYRDSRHCIPLMWLYFFNINSVSKDYDGNCALITSYDNAISNFNRNIKICENYFNSDYFAHFKEELSKWIYSNKNSYLVLDLGELLDPDDYLIWSSNIFDSIEPQKLINDDWIASLKSIKNNPQLNLIGYTYNK